MLSKKISIVVVLILATFLSVGFAFARDLEVPLPQTGGGSAITQTPLLPDYIKYIFNFSIGIAGLIAFLTMVYGGFRYLTSAGNPSAMSDANSQIFASLIGLVILFGSYLLLTTINPQLVVINPGLTSSGLTTTTIPGVYLCKEQTGDPATNCDGPYNTDKNSWRFLNFFPDMAGTLFPSLLRLRSVTRLRLAIHSACELVVPPQTPQAALLDVLARRAGTQRCSIRDSGSSSGQKHDSTDGILTNCLLL